jgi:tetratricopeptide (TPR) repeat protein
VREHGWLTLEELWGWKQIDTFSQAQMQQHYASAWLWVHYLMNEHAERFADFQGRLARAEEPRQAFEAAFRGVQDLAGGLRTYVDTGRYAVLTIPLPEVSSKVELRDLDGAEIHAIRARLRLMTPGTATAEQRKQQATQELAQALREDPMNVSAAELHSELAAEPSQRLEVARGLVQAKPDDGRAWGLLARAIGMSGGSGEEQEKALVRAAELLPNRADALNSLAWFYAGTGRPDKAMAPSSRAVQLAPGDAAVLDTHASVLFQLGRCAEAVKVQRRAVDVLHEQASESFRRSIQGSLDRYEQSCRQATPRQP